MAVPRRTMSTTVLKALAESRSVGEMKFPAALLTTQLGRDPKADTHASTASFTWEEEGEEEEETEEEEEEREEEH